MSERNAGGIILVTSSVPPPWGSKVGGCIEYVCMYVCMYARTYTCMHVCMHAARSVGVQVCKYKLIKINTFVHVDNSGHLS